jgi:hypothetical protein
MGGSCSKGKILAYQRIITCHQSAACCFDSEPDIQEFLIYVGWHLIVPTDTILDPALFPCFSISSSRAFSSG